MSYIHPFYQGGKSLESILGALWGLVKDKIETGNAKKPYNFGRTLRQKGKPPNLTDCLKENLSKLDGHRKQNAFKRWEDMNKGILENLDQLKGRRIIFTDPVSPTKLDPKFLFSYLKHMGIKYPDHAPAWYAKETKRLWQDPMSPLWAQTDAMMLLAAVNPQQWDRQVFWPVSFFAIPYEIKIEDEVYVKYVYDDLFKKLDLKIPEGRIGLGSIRKTMQYFMPFEEQIGTFQCNPGMYSTNMLRDQLVENERDFKKDIEYLKKRFGWNWDDAVEHLHEWIKFETKLKEIITAHYYSDIIDKLELEEAVLFSPKKCTAQTILERSIKNLKREGKEIPLRFVEYELDKNDPGPYSYLDWRALRKLNGEICVMSGVDKEVVTVKERRDLKLDKEVEFNECKYAPVLCEGAYGYTCERDLGRTDNCTLDNFLELEKEGAEKLLGIDEGWMGAFRKENKTNEYGRLWNLAQFTKRILNMMKFRPYSVEQVLYLLNKGENYPVYTTTDMLEGVEMDHSDKRRQNARTSWWAEKNQDVIFPFVHKDFEATGATQRISSVGVKCEIARILGMMDVAPKVLGSWQATIGTIVHYLMNENPTGKKLMQEELLEKYLGIPYNPRETWCENEVYIDFYDEETKRTVRWSGHSDCVCMKAPREIMEKFYAGESLKGEKIDLVIVDFKTSRSTPQPAKKYKKQIGLYSMAYKQRIKEGVAPIKEMLECEVRNCYMGILQRPSIDGYQSQKPLKQTIKMVKFTDEEQLKNEIKESIRVQEALKTDPCAFWEYKLRQKEKGACEKPDGDWSKVGCFDDQRIKCECMCEQIGSRSIKQYGEDMG